MICYAALYASLTNTKLETEFKFTVYSVCKNVRSKNKTIYLQFVPFFYSFIHKKSMTVIIYPSKLLFEEFSVFYLKIDILTLHFALSFILFNPFEMKIM